MFGSAKRPFEAWRKPHHLLEWEEEERGRRSLERRISGAKIGAFKAMADFDREWPEKIDRDLEESYLAHRRFLAIANTALPACCSFGESRCWRGRGSAQT